MSNEDPFALDPKRPLDFIVHKDKPFNGEASSESLLTQKTGNDMFYIRNHLAVPLIKPEEYVLEIEVPIFEEPVHLTLSQLQTQFKKHQISATITCAGNRRADMQQIESKWGASVNGLSWKSGAIGNADWKGILLSDVLERYISKEDMRKHSFHIQFEGYDCDVSDYVKS